MRAQFSRHYVSRSLAQAGRIKGMSGGQKCRLVLAAAVWTRPHVIALDEPTNYLDNETLNALTSALKRFKGAILVISHHAVSLVSCLPLGSCSHD